MSSDLLPLPEIWSDLPDGTANENARGELGANGHSGLVLIEYASGYTQTDPQPFTRPLDPVEQAASNERMPSLVPAALAKGLADLVAIVTQAEALLRAQGTLKGDVHFAVERIHDVAMALRMRDVDSALCDTLEASVREVGDAVVRHEAAATGALSAAALLRDVMRRIEDLSVVVLRVTATEAEPLVGSQAIVAQVVVEAPAPLVAETAAEEPAPAPLTPEVWRNEEVQPQALSAQPEAEAIDRPQAEAADTPVPRPVDDLIAHDEHARPQLDAVLNEESSKDVAPESRAIAASPIAATKDEAAEPAESPAIAAAKDKVVEPIESMAIAAAKDEVVEPVETVAIAARDDGAVEPIESIAIAAPKDEVVEPADSMTALQQESNDAPAASEPEGEAVSRALAAEVAASVVAEARGEQQPQQRASSFSVGESGTVAAIKPPRPANDPLAALHGLSEEELIALFC